jgi:hypothetical protein
MNILVQFLEHYIEANGDDDAPSEEPSSDPGCIYWR